MCEEKGVVFVRLEQWYNGAEEVWEFKRRWTSFARGDDVLWGVAAGGWLKVRPQQIPSDKRRHREIIRCYNVLCVLKGIEGAELDVAKLHGIDRNWKQGVWFHGYHLGALHLPMKGGLLISQLWTDWESVKSSSLKSWQPWMLPSKQRFGCFDGRCTLLQQATMCAVQIGQK